MMAEAFEHLTIDGYARQAAATDQRSSTAELGFHLLGLVGETGTLLSEAKKKQRDEASYLGYAEAVAEELGDVLWYLAAIARRSHLSLADIALSALSGDRRREDLSPVSITFHDLQPATMEFSKAPMPRFEQTLLMLASKVGDLITSFVNSELENDQPRVRDHLVSVAEKLIEASTESGITMEAAAAKNLHKIFDRWPQERRYPDAFDEGFELEERLPRTMTIDIYEREVRGKTFVYQRSNHIYVGDRLTDNAVEPDDYRFHDVFHYTYVAVLGWSPVMRALFRLKRKSDPLLDEAQDGARAILIEEGLTSWLFTQAQQLRFFDKVERGGLPLDLLKQVRAFVSGYEAEQCPLWLWEEAILQGYSAFRFLQEKRRARLTIDFEQRELQVAELPA
ncbi:nucleoside triphosphate pyrophosphohydrolase family protein [uncultured Erythrobacter sp.]|uniref:nucleoside triphosphate pyrophosphohydrolase family protein n=1 Tax=uncultured Erythrobacter sp. TaxID=263913 RepID=UPI002606E458|nr:nucleoside triphosphate pyrophosphohydrolase family protein [uncultured Erythrobacter sp.]